MQSNRSDGLSNDVQKGPHKMVLDLKRIETSFENKSLKVVVVRASLCAAGRALSAAELASGLVLYHAILNG